MIFCPLFGLQEDTEMATEQESAVAFSADSSLNSSRLLESSQSLRAEDDEGRESFSLLMRVQEAEGLSAKLLESNSSLTDSLKQAHADLEALLSGRDALATACHKLETDLLQERSLSIVWLKADMDFLQQRKRNMQAALQQVREARQRMQKMAVVTEGGSSTVEAAQQQGDAGSAMSQDGH